MSRDESAGVFGIGRGDADWEMFCRGGGEGDRRADDDPFT